MILFFEVFLTVGAAVRRKNWLILLLFPLLLVVGAIAGALITYVSITTTGYADLDTVVIVGFMLDIAYIILLAPLVFGPINHPTDTPTTNPPTNQ